jgi:hypothetical protein
LSTWTRLIAKVFQVDPRRPPAGGRRGARPPTSLICPEPLPASPHSGRGVCAGQSRRDVLHPERATGDA